MVEFFKPIYSIPSASLSILLYLFSALVRLLLLNAISLSMLLSGASSLGQLVLLLVCNKAAPSPAPDASVSIYLEFHACIFCNDCFCHVKHLLVCCIPGPLCFDLYELS